MHSKRPRVKKGPTDLTRRQWEGKLKTIASQQSTASLRAREYPRTSSTFSQVHRLTTPVSTEMERTMTRSLTKRVFSRHFQQVVMHQLIIQPGISKWFRITWLRNLHMKVNRLVHRSKPVSSINRNQKEKSWGFKLRNQDHSRQA